MNTPDHLAYDAHRIIGDVAASIRSANARLHVTSHRTKVGWAEQLEAALAILARPTTGDPTRAPDLPAGAAITGKGSLAVLGGLSNDEWDELRDAIGEAIDDTLDIDWTGIVGARGVIEHLKACYVVAKKSNDSGKSGAVASNDGKVASEGLEPISTLHGPFPGNCGLEADTYTMPAEVASALCGLLVAQDRRLGEAWANRDAAEKASRKALDDLAFVKGEHARLERVNGEMNRTLANMMAMPVRYTDDQRAVAQVALTRAHGDYHPTPADYGRMVDAVAGALGMVRAVTAA